ncbi:MAG: F0F1 ATP synthase subunit A [Phycisphaerales bacterium]|nr:F0F1 ATP synthase subunit A [Phycisphaerales bacterium]
MLDLLVLADGPADHVVNHVWWRSADGWWLWSGNQGNLVLSAIIMILGFLWFARQVRTGPESQGSDRYLTRNRFAHAIEVVCLYLRNEIVEPMLGERTDRFMPILWTLFFFVLVNNLLGLVPIMDTLHMFFPQWAAEHRAPIGGTATQNLWVTGALALFAGIVFNVAAVVRLGIGGFFRHMTAGAPWYVVPVIFVIELFGQFVIKPGALAIRLFANMTAGHTLLATLFLFIVAAWGQGIALKGTVTAASFLGAVFIMVLELLVATIQAFIFMFLTAVFISLMDHHEEHGHEHGHGHATGHEHAHA